MQTGLLPHTLPRLPGFDVVARYRPAGHGMDIGSDFYDLIVCTPTTAAAVIGDVQGHKTTAAALMGQVRTAVHAYAATTRASPGEVLACTNRLLVDLDPGLLLGRPSGRRPQRHDQSEGAGCAPPPGTYELTQRAT